MLVISRKKNQTLIIGGNIFVTVIEVRGDVVDLEIKSPKESVIASCKRNESRILGDNISVTVLDIRGDNVRLGIESPKDMPTHRKEVYDHRPPPQDESE